MPKSLLLLALLLTGCSPVSEVTRPRFLFGTQADGDDTIELSRLAYPAEAPVGPDLDVVLITRGSTITLVNRTTGGFKNVQLWLNKQYVARIDELPVAGRENIALDDAINKYGEAYPIGGLLNPDKTYPIVLAELHIGATGDGSGLRHKIIVRSED